MSGCQRCLECGCLAVSDVLCADVWLSAINISHDIAGISFESRSIILATVCLQQNWQWISWI